LVRSRLDSLEKISLCDIDAPHRYRLIAEASGGSAGQVTTQIGIKLVALEPELTLLDYRLDATVSGKLAQLGSPLLESTAQEYANRFFAAFEQQIKTGPTDFGLDHAMTNSVVNPEKFSADHKNGPAADADNALEPGPARSIARELGPDAPGELG
jgi:hypothetical protein